MRVKHFFELSALEHVSLHHVVHRLREAADVWRGDVPDERVHVGSAVGGNGKQVLRGHVILVDNSVKQLLVRGARVWEPGKWRTASATSRIFQSGEM